MTAGLIAAVTGVALLGVAPTTATARTRFCHGHRATMVGTRRADLLVGTPGRDVIVARGGADKVIGGPGRDTICGNRGNDLIDGASGRRDRAYGGKGIDACLATVITEHQYHHACDIHLPGAPPPIHPTSGMTSSLTRAMSTTSMSRVSTTVSGPSFSFFHDNPDPGFIQCNQNGSIATPQGMGTSNPVGNPSTSVGIVPVFFALIYPQGWVYEGLAADPQIVDIPTDGLEYGINFPAMNVNNTEDYRISYFFFYWDGSSWDTSPWVYKPVDHYDWNSGYLIPGMGECIGGAGF